LVRSSVFFYQCQVLEKKCGSGCDDGIFCPLENLYFLYLKSLLGNALFLNVTSVMSAVSFL
jgi:hypothetical protein